MSLVTLDIIVLVIFQFAKIKYLPLTWPSLAFFPLGWVGVGPRSALDSIVFVIGQLSNKDNTSHN